MWMRVVDIGPSPSRTRLVGRLYKICTMILLYSLCIQKRLDVCMKKFSYSNQINIFYDYLHDNYNRSQVRIEVLCQSARPDK